MKQKIYKIVPIMETIMESKEEDVLELFFENPSKEWHFEEVLQEAGIARSKGAKWLKSFIREGLIKRVKEKGKMPHYLSNYDSPPYKNRKKLFGLHQLYASGFLNHLSSLPRAKSVILFGSYARSDWYKKSDIDLFIYGDPKGLHIAPYELKLRRDIQVFVCRGKEDLRKFGEGLIKNVIKGNLIKGDMDFVKVSVNA